MAFSFNDPPAMAEPLSPDQPIKTMDNPPAAPEAFTARHFGDGFLAVNGPLYSRRFEAGTGRLKREVNSAGTGRRRFGYPIGGLSPDGSSVKKSTLRHAAKKKGRSGPCFMCHEVCPANTWHAHDWRCLYRQRCAFSGSVLACLALAPAQLRSQTHTGNRDQQQAGWLGHLVGGNGTLTILAP